MSFGNHSDTAITDDAIAKRAYEIWQARGCPQGDGTDDWRLAKKQLQAESAAEAAAPIATPVAI